MTIVTLDYIHSDRLVYNQQIAQIDKIANILIETTRILSHRFQLTVEEINDGLPMIDTSKTDIWKICPEFLKPATCNMTRFRTIDGSCSSMRNSVLGTTNTPFYRPLLPDYDDGIGLARRTSVTKAPLPNVRRVSINVHQDLSRLSNRHTNLLISWSQHFGDDLVFGGILREENGTRISCCPDKTHPLCAPIHIPKDDPFYSKFGDFCMDAHRTVAGIRPGCALGPRIQLNMVTTRIDASALYGSTDLKSERRRQGSKGLLKVWDKFSDLGLKELLPPLMDDPEKDCIGRPRQLFCFVSGDERLNIQPDAVVLHTILARYHNQLAKQLAYLNPHWDDERLFQETRHIVAASIQHIGYNEFLPVFLGPKYMRMYNLTLTKEGYWDGYDENTPIATLLPFQTAAYRYAHSMVDNKLRLYNKNHEFVDSQDMHDFLRQPFLIYRPGAIDKLIAGFLNAPPQTFDRFMSSELTRHLFEEPKQHYGQDLASLNMNRGRDHGLPGYNFYREWCGLSRIKTFEELEHHMGNGTGFRYAQVYKHPDDIDLWSGGLSERAVDGGIVGPTFSCIIAAQFNNLRKADRFWYENPGFPSSFTPGQLREIKKITQAKITCDSSDNIQTLQMWAMELPDPKYNPRMNCKDLPSINLDYWIEDPVKKTFLYTR